MKKNYIYGHTNFENAYEVSNYPWGFRLRTEVRYWIETNDKKNGGERFCKCTKDPKTGKWCAPKKGNYYALAHMYLDENEHVHFEAVYDGNATNLLEFIESHLQHLTDYQIKEIKYLKAYQEVMSKVEFGLVINPSKEQADRIEENKKSEIAKINFFINRISKLM